MKGFFTALIATLSLFGFTSMAQAGTHVHFASFFAGKGIEFPATVAGDDIEGPMVKLGAEMSLFAHSAAIKHNDVLNLQNDTLREINGEFKDIGVNCQISMSTEGEWTVGGRCEVFMQGDARVNHIIKPTPIHKELIWYKVFEDKEQGVAGYFMKEQGNTLD